MHILKVYYNNNGSEQNEAISVICDQSVGTDGFWSLAFPIQSFEKTKTKPTN